MGRSGRFACGKTTANRRSAMGDANIKNIANEFTEKIKHIYGDNLVSVVLFGSAASGESSGKNSDINVLVVLGDESLDAIARSTSVLTSRKFRNIDAVFFSEKYMKTTTDVFPIEFLDMKDNYKVLYGKDVLMGLSVDLKNLRFQCEQELKSKLIAIKKAYPRIVARDAARAFLFKTFTSSVHVLRNLLRLKGEAPPYRKEDAMKLVASRFGVDGAVFKRILDAKQSGAKLSIRQADELLCDFTKELERLTDAVDRF
jgi:predicted nucleotidyltransferase